MLKNTTNIKQANKGFTIIEVLIVLAIAGLILLIVFLAVPALQRNSRNTTRRSDISRVGGAASEYVANNNGTLPTNSDKAALLAGVGTLGSYDLTAAGNFAVVTGGTPAPIRDVNKVRLVTGVECDVNGRVKEGTTRQMAVQYAIENGNGSQTTQGTPICTNI